MNKYLIDTNIFIESAYRFYAFDICPGFWEFLEKCSQTDYIKSIDKVYSEITSSKPELQDFREILKSAGFFLSKDKINPKSYMKVSQKLVEMKYSKSAIEKFSSGADYFLIALALQETYTIVTHETKSGNNATHIIKIPNVCEQLGVSCIDIAEFLRCERAKFVLEQNRTK